MFRQTHAQKQIAALSAARPGFALSSETDALTFVNAAWNFYLIGFDFVRTRAAQRDRSLGTLQNFLERNENVRFDVRAAFGRCFAASESSECRAAPSAAEKRFKEIAESSAAEFKLDSTAAIAAPLMKSAAGLLPPLRRRLKSAGLVPIRAELIVFLAFLGITQDFVGFVNLFKFFLSRFFVLRDVGMMFAREFAECAFDFVIRRVFRNAERFIVIPELHCHRALNLVPPMSSRNLLWVCTT